MKTLSEAIKETIDNSRRRDVIQPTILGGSEGANGGGGTPYGGIVGRLIQTKVTYDTTEAATLSTSGYPSLLDNLNHMRYNTAQNTTNITVLSGWVTTLSGVVASISGTGGSTSLSGLIDVSLSNPIEGQSLVYSGGYWRNVTVSGSSSVTVLSALLDTSISNPTNGQVLVYSGGLWRNANVSASGISTPTSHSSLTDLTNNDHPQYILRSGLAGGQTLIGGTGMSDKLYLNGTSGGFGTGDVEVLGNLIIDGGTTFTAGITAGNITGVNGELAIKGGPYTLPNRVVIANFAVFDEDGTDGKLGIGMVPTERLTVSGNIRAYGDVYANNLITTTDFDDIFRFGLIMNYAGTQETTYSFDGTNTYTLTPTGTTWSYWRNGYKYTISGAKTVTLSGTPPAAKGTYFIYIDSTDGALISSTSSWTLADTKVPVAIINWDNTLTPKYHIQDERHTCAIDRRFHFEHHFTDGTEVRTMPALSGYSVAPASPADTNNTFAISEGIIVDEDLSHTLDALADQNGTDSNYYIWYRTAASTWVWATSQVPFRYTAAGYIQYDNAGTMTEGAGNKFYNTYLLLTTLGGVSRFAFIHGQATFNTLALAQAENFDNLTKTGLGIAEYVAAYQLTWETSAGYTTKGKCRLAATPKPIKVSATGLSTGGSIEHNTTAGLQGGIAGEYYHLNSTNYTDLTDGGDSTLHYHSSDRNLSTCSGIVAITNGGTGAITKAAGFDALSPMTAAGDIIYGGTSGTGTRLAKGTAYQQLRMNSGATAPEWASGRERLAAGKTYYVRTDGSDSNTGLVNNAGGAFLTLQKAINVASSSLDLDIYTAVIYLADGTYTTSGNVAKQCMGAGQVLIVGNASNPENVIIDVTGNYGCGLFSDSISTVYHLQYLKIQSSNAATSVYGLYASNGAYVYFTGLEFGTGMLYHINSNFGGKVNTASNYKVSGGATGHVIAQVNSYFQASGSKITASGTIAWSNAFCVATQNGNARFYSVTASGTFTGSYYSVTANGVIIGTSQLTGLGNSAGSYATGGQPL